MTFNWMDILILVILAVTLILGLIKGFIRQVIGLAAVVVGLLLAATYYLPVSRTVRRVVAAEKWSELIAFLLVFLAVLVAGWLIAFLVSKLIRGPLRFIDHLFGGALGLLKGVLICGVIVFALLAFPVDKKALLKSELAPYCYWITKGIVRLIPQELKDRFKETYKDIIKEKRPYGKEV
jgi:membrane protein required for colicin V production